MKKTLVIAIALAFCIHSNAQTMLYGLLSKNGKEILPVEYSEIKIWSDYLITAKKDGEVYLLAPDGNKISNQTCENIEPFVGNFLQVTQNGKLGIIDNQGKLLVPAEFNKITVEDGFIVVQKFRDEYDKPFGLYDANGIKLIDCAYESYLVLPNGNMLATMRSNDNSFLFDKTGKLIKTFENCMYQKREIWPYIAIVKDRYNTQLACFIDFDGNEIRPFEMEKFWFLRYGAKYKQGEYYYYIDDNLKDVCKIKGYEIYDIYNDYLLLKHLTKDKRGIANSIGEIIVPVKFEYSKLPPIPADNFKIVPVTGNKPNKYISISSYIPPKPIEYSETNKLITNNNRTGVVTSAGSEIIPCNYDEIKILPNYFVVGIMQAAQISSNGSEDSEDTSRVCYSAILQKESNSFGTRATYNAAIFVEITVVGSFSESEIKNFGYSKAQPYFGGYKIASQLLDYNYDCRQCKATADKVMTLEDFRIIYETMR